MMFARPPIVAAFVLLLAPAGPARAGWMNPGFESGTGGWSAAGDVGVVGASIGIAPREGAAQALLTTASLDGDAFTFFGTDAVGAAGLELFLGLAPGALGAGFEGAALRQTLTVAAGDTLRFEYQFLTAEGGMNDFALVTLGGGYTVLADRATAALGPSAVVLDPVFGDPARETGWRAYSHTFTTAGTYTLGIAVLDAGDGFVPSGLLVDNGRLVPAGGPVPTPTPEPSALALAAVGAAGLALGRRFGRSRVPS